MAPAKDMAATLAAGRITMAETGDTATIIAVARITIVPVQIVTVLIHITDPARITARIINPTKASKAQTPGHIQTR
jgi:hypothetical protein